MLANRHVGSCIRISSSSLRPSRTVVASNYLATLPLYCVLRRRSSMRLLPFLNEPSCLIKECQLRPLSDAVVLHAECVIYHFARRKNVDNASPTPKWNVVLDRLINLCLFRSAKFLRVLRIPTTIIAPLKSTGCLLVRNQIFSISLTAEINLKKIIDIFYIETSSKKLFVLRAVNKWEYWRGVLYMWNVNVLVIILLHYCIIRWECLTIPTENFPIYS